MAELPNPRHEQFCQLICTGHTPARAYVAAGYSEKTAYTSGPRLLKTPTVSARVAELQRSVAHSAGNRAAIDRDWVLSGLRGIAENGASESARVRAFELVGKELGMFVERPPAPWDGDLTKLTNAQLERVTEQLIAQACEGVDPAIVEEVTRELTRARSPQTAIAAQFEEVNQKAHGAQSNPTQAEKNSVPASSVGWRRSG